MLALEGTKVLDFSRNAPGSLGCTPEQVADLRRRQVVQ